MKRLYSSGIVIILVCLLVLLTGCDDLSGDRTRGKGGGNGNSNGNGNGNGNGNAPAVPAELKASVGNTTITVTWNSVSSVSGYKVYYSTSPYGNYSLLRSVNSVSTDHTGLTPNQTYYYKVSAYNSYGESAQSSYSYATPSTSATPIEIVVDDEYYFSNTLSAGYTHYYRFYATVGNSYCVDWADIDLNYNNAISPPVADIKVGVRGTTWFVNITDTGNYNDNLHRFSISGSGWVTIEVQGYSASSNGNYGIAALKSN